MTLGDFGYAVGYVTVGIFLGFIAGFSRGQVTGRRTGKVEGWIYAYRELVEKIKSQGSIDSSGYKPVIDPKKTVVLVVEDNEDARQMLVAVLKLYGFKVLEARDGTEGLHLAVTESPHCAVVDIKLSDLSGYEVARRLRADPKTSGMRLIALTGYSLEQDKQRAIDSGYDSYMSKPYHLDKLVSAIQSS